ncbi:unnamed protein product [Cutaneotrichosporon oleaginosum]
MLSYARLLRPRGLAAAAAAGPSARTYSRHPPSPPPRRGDRADLAGRTPRPPPRSPRTKLAAVRPGALAHIVTGSRPSPARDAMLADEAGDLELRDDARVDDDVPVLPSPQAFPPRAFLPQAAPLSPARPPPDEWRRQQSARDRERARTLAPEPASDWGRGGTWRDWDTSRLPPLDAAKFTALPADFENTIAAANARRAEKVSVRYALFTGMSIPASHVPGGGALPLPPFAPRLRRTPGSPGWAAPDGLEPRERAHWARRSADARAGTGFAFPRPGTPDTPASARIFVLVPKARVSRLSVERRRCRCRFFAAWAHVTNRSEGAPPLSHARVYSFVLNPAIHDAPFHEICETVERAIKELDRKLQPTPKGRPRWAARR